MKLSAALLALGCFFTLGLDYAIATPLPHSIPTVEHTAEHPRSIPSPQSHEPSTKRDGQATAQQINSWYKDGRFRSHWSFSGFRCADLQNNIAYISDQASESSARISAKHRNFQRWAGFFDVSTKDSTDGRMLLACALSLTIEKDVQQCVVVTGTYGQCCTFSHGLAGRRDLGVLSLLGKNRWGRDLVGGEDVQAAAADLNGKALAKKDTDDG